MSVSSPFKIGKVEIGNRLALAPMAGYTDLAMRQLCVEAGAGLTVTEMVSAKGLVYSPEKSAPLLLTSGSEKVKCVQLFGHEPEYFVKALKSPLLAQFDIIDINMGCPVPKIVKNGEGSALILKPDLAKKIVEACVEASSNRPVTVKTRVGFYENTDTSIEFCKGLVNAGASAITLHGRTKEQGYAGLSDWEAIERLYHELPVPVIGSGDVTEENASELENRATALMVGRHAVGNSEIFAKILGNSTAQSKAELALRHFELMLRYYGEHYALVNIRHHIGGYLRGVRGQKEIKLALFSATTANKVREIISQI